MKRALLLAGMLACKKAPLEATPDDAHASETTKTDPWIGRFRADVSHREVEGRRVGDTIEFRVVDAAQWAGAYSTGEVRFSIKPDAGVYRVTDRYRPLLQAGIEGRREYSAAGRESCLVERTEIDGKPLIATLAGDTLTVDFAEVEVRMIADLLDIMVIDECRDPRVRGRLTLTLHRVR